ncbi:MAG: hypothetical protein GWN09_07080 [Gammaproteobacteria bacterium]|nr:hypothetical protein [Gammaproteobacteria bacterium]
MGLTACALCLVLGFGSTAATEGYLGSRFADVREALAEGRYAALPHFVVDAEQFGPPGDGPENRLREAARRTLESRTDLIEFPAGRKLLQPNGICFTGQWRITEPSPYTGLLATGAHALAVARASVSLSETTRGHRRAFSLAVKLFPTRDPSERVPTANLLTMVSILGSRAKHFLNVALDNEPPLGGWPGLGDLLLGLRIRADLKAAEAAVTGGRTDIDYRPLTPLASAGLPAGPGPVAPRWLRLRVAAETPRVDADDFRDELRLNGYPGGVLAWEIEVADGTPGAKATAEWRQLGELLLTEDFLSVGCDARLHFAHPRLEESGRDPVCTRERFAPAKEKNSER